MIRIILITLCSIFFFTSSIYTQSSITIHYAGTPYCNNGFATVSRNGDSLGAKYSSTPIGLAIDSLTGTIDLNKSIPKTYTVFYTINCLSTKCIYSTSVTVHNVASTIKYESDTFCRAPLPLVQSVILTGTGSILGGIYTSKPFGLSINSSTGDITPSLGSSGTYQVVYTYQDTICGTFHDTTNVSIVDKVTTQITIIASAATICSGNSVTFTANPKNEGTEPNYQWYKNGFPIKDSTNVTLTYNLFENDTITCKLLSNNECSIFKTANSNSIIITVCKPTSGFINVFTCCGVFIWHGNIYRTSGTFTFDSLNLKGCDSLTTLNLTLTEPPTRDTTVTTCGSFLWHGINYTSTGTATLNIKNLAGCDSVVTLHLNITQPTTGNTTAIACKSFYWHGTTYYSSGTYTFDSLNLNRCDSLLTLQLTINPVPVVTDIIGFNTLYVGQKIDLIDNTNSGVWGSLNHLIATIDNTGQITGISKGIDTINYIVSNTCGADTANFKIVVLPNTLFIPNVFSPNASGVNDIFLVRGAGNLVNQMELRIFDSWGNELFLSKGDINDRSKGWDGTFKGSPQPPGVYVYVVRLEMKTGEFQIKKGAINLIR